MSDIAMLQMRIIILLNAAVEITRIHGVKADFRAIPVAYIVRFIQSAVNNLRCSDAASRGAKFAARSGDDT